MTNLIGQVLRTPKGRYWKVMDFKPAIRYEGFYYLKRASDGAEAEIPYSIFEDKIKRQVWVIVSNTEKVFTDEEYQEFFV